MAKLQIQKTENAMILVAQGNWMIQHITSVDQMLRQFSCDPHLSLTFHTENIENVDTAGAWIIYRFLNQCQQKEIRVLTPRLHPILESLFNKFPPYTDAATPPVRSLSMLMNCAFCVGQSIILKFDRSLRLLSFLGACVIYLIESLKQRKFRFKSMLASIEQTGLNAMPIIGMISFLTGNVLIYQAVFQLRRFGAEIFAIDMLAISLSREVGILITAIVVAGRSGSSFTAQIGTMKLNQETDALRVLGINPLEVLVIPRIVALTIALPLLTFYALVMGLAGGAIMCYFSLQMDFSQYIHQLHQALTIESFFVGMVKAPFFAFIIALVGCFHGMRVSGGAENLGQRTTRSVVESIFLVIVLNGLFSIVFTYLGI